MSRRPLLIALPVAAVALIAGCGNQGIQLAQNDPLYDAAVLFQNRCAGCHSFSTVGAQGSSTNPNNTERKDGPNFNERAVAYEEALYAIRNGGFSSGPMPQNIVVGREAEQVACFVAVYSGRSADRSTTPGGAPTGLEPDNTCVQQVAE